jgi:hypothetical protein
MSKSQPLLPVVLLDELRNALDRMDVVAGLIGLVGRVDDPAQLSGKCLSRAAALITSDAFRLRRLLDEHESVASKFSKSVRSKPAH